MKADGSGGASSEGQRRLDYWISPLDFCFWLRGYFELCPGGDLDETQWKVVLAHLHRALSRPANQPGGSVGIGSTSGAGGAVTIFRAPPPPPPPPKQPNPFAFCEWLRENAPFAHVLEVREYLDKVFSSAGGVTITC